MPGRSALEKGKVGERYVADQYREHMGFDVRRMQAGHKDDLGDLSGIPETTVQVKNYASLAEAVRLGIPDLAAQQARTGDQFGVLWAKGGRGMWVCVQTPLQHMTLLREALA